MEGFHWRAEFYSLGCTTSIFRSVPELGILETDRFREKRLRFLGKTGTAMMTENEIATVVVDTSLKVHRALGPGLLESAYEVVMARALRKRGLHVERQVMVPIVWDDETIDEGFRADLIVGEKLIIELKSVARLAKVHFRQLLTYLRLTDRKLGLLVNFNEVLIKDGIHRVVNGLEESDSSSGFASPLFAAPANQPASLRAPLTQRKTQR